MEPTSPTSAPVERTPRTPSMADRWSDAMPWLDSVAAGMRKTFAPFAGEQAPRMLKDALNGTWLGHPLHPAIVTLPLGTWSAASVFDLMGERRAADLSIALGVAASGAAAMSGAAQWYDLQNREKPRRIGVAHATLNTVALGTYIGSLALRANGRRTAGVMTAGAGLGVVSLSGWLGGHLSYNLGVGVDHATFEPRPKDWVDVLSEAQLAEGDRRRVEADGAPVLLTRQGGEVYAIGATCPHLGGPLDEGEIRTGGDGCSPSVACPWHDSVFDLRDGSVCHSPSTIPATTYHVRIADGTIAVRAADETGGAVTRT